MVCIHCERRLPAEMFPFDGVPACWECLTPEKLTERVEAMPDGPMKDTFLEVGRMYGLVTR